MSRAEVPSVARAETFACRCKTYEVPIFDEGDPVILTAGRSAVALPDPADCPVLRCLNSTWDLAAFVIARRPISLGDLSVEELETIDRRTVEPGTLHREAPCHVDAFEGARWQAAVPGQLHGARRAPARLLLGDERAGRRHPRGASLAATAGGDHVDGLLLRASRRGERGPVPVFRTWLRVSFEERRRAFDRLGNAHNPLFDYDWPMVDRDIEQLGLRAFRETSDASLQVFPWQDLEGQPLPKGAPKTKPRRRAG